MLWSLSLKWNSPVRRCPVPRRARPRSIEAGVLAACAGFTAGVAGSAPAPERVERWTPKGVSSELFESHAAFDPLTGDLYFVRSSKSFSGWRILTAHCVGERWSAPNDAPFAGKG